MKKNNYLIIIALLLIASLISILSTYYFMNQNITELKNELSDKKCDSDEPKSNDKYQILNNTYYDLVLTKGEVYINVYMDEEELNSYYGAGSYEKLIATRQNYKAYDFGNLLYSKLDEKLKTMKLNIKDVVKVIEYNNGQSVEASTLGLIVLTKDGNVHVISYYSLINGKSDLKKINEVSNIKDIEMEHNGNGVQTNLIDNSGKKINIFEYMPKNYTEW